MDRVLPKECSHLGRGEGCVRLSRIGMYRLSNDQTWSAYIQQSVIQQHLNK